MFPLYPCTLKIQDSAEKRVRDREEAPLSPIRKESRSKLIIRSGKSDTVVLAKSTKGH